MSSEDDEEGEGEEGNKEFSWSGLLEDFEPVGPGIATYPNGDIFEGSYYGGKRHGFGKYTFTKDAATYEGNYTDNQKAGFGTMSFPDKSSYTGSWYQDKRSGEGQYTYKNGDIYKGQWFENKKHGVGSYFFKNDMAQFIGIWEKGFFAKGKWLFKNGDFYEGDFAKSKPEGPGKFMFFKSKCTVAGTFEKGKWTLGTTKQTPAKVILDHAMQAAPSLFAPPLDTKSLPSFVIPMKFK
ncbi:uncharacterized protein [Physcomitrium patens]|uniref:Uncharacterized protein n=1 Tax=Physcomitrium patens TaxID=3218 RepID=A0A7I4A3T1_PHYPA|nr:radial spoke head 1 homolog [Physcomitrium patens]|eukprot:XP_024385861.1 radial spoke head 1 homolog [Physcomitrella patens]